MGASRGPAVTPETLRKYLLFRCRLLHGKFIGALVVSVVGTCEASLWVLLYRTLDGEFFESLSSWIFFVPITYSLGSTLPIRPSEGSIMSLTITQ